MAESIAQLEVMRDEKDRSAGISTNHIGGVTIPEQWGPDCQSLIKDKNIWL